MANVRVLKDSETNRQLLASSRKVKRVYQFVAVAVIAALLSSALTLSISANGPSEWGTRLTSGSLVQDADFVVYVDDTEYKARNGTTGGIDFTSTNATSVITDCLELMPSGGLLSLANAEYEIEFPIIVPRDKNLIIQGSGASVLHNTGELETLSLENALSNTANVQVKDLIFEGSETATHGITARLEINTIVSGCTFTGHSNGAGIYLDWGSYYWRVSDCYFYENSYAILADDTITGTTSCNALSIYGCRFSEQIDQDINIAHGSMFSLSDCTLEGVSDSGAKSGSIYLENCSDSRISSLYTEGGYGEFINLKDCDRSAIWGVKGSVSGGLDGINISSSDHVTVESTSISYADAVINVQASNYVALSGISFEWNVNHLIETDASSTYTTISQCHAVGSSPFGAVFAINGDYAALSQCYVLNVNHIGFQLLGDFITVTNCKAINCSKSYSGQLPGIYLYNNRGCTISSCVIADFQTSPTMKYGIKEEGTTCDYNRYLNNYFYGASTAQLLEYGTHNLVAGNVGYVTENKGTATITSTTFVTFNHGLVTTPTLVLASFNAASYGNYTWTATTTQITITVSTSGTYTVYWYAEV